MWVFKSARSLTNIEKSQKCYLIIKARVASDLDRLRKEYMPQLSRTTVCRGIFYPFQATISHRDFGWGIARMRQDIQSSSQAGASKSGSGKEKRYNQNAEGRFENLRFNEDVRVALYRLFVGKTMIVCPFGSCEGKTVHVAFFRLEEVIGEEATSGQDGRTKHGEHKKSNDSRR